jgi:UTP--glucose-1-phosphate uridylyltransferase
MIKFVYQNIPKGTGDAVLKCNNLIKGKYFLMLLPDDLIINKNCSKEMLSLFNKKKSSIIATKIVHKNTVSRWGILSLKNKKKNYFQITNVVEKPSIKSAPSNYAIIGRYILPKNIMFEIKKLKPGQGGEIHITDAIRNLILNGEKFYGNIFKGKYLDCGTLNGYINSGVEMLKQYKK